MKRYSIEIPLIYNKEYQVERYNIKNRQLLFLDKNIELKRIEENSNDQCKEKFNTSIKINSCEEKIYIVINECFFDDENYALEFAEEISKRICCYLTYLYQIQNKDPQYAHYKFDYKSREIKIEDKGLLCQTPIIEKKGNITKLNLSDKIMFREKVGITAKKTILTEQFNKLYYGIKNNSKLEFLLRSYYRALGEIDDISKFYNLFVIIEYIETNYTDKIDAKKTFEKEISKEIVGAILPIMEKYHFGNEIIGRMNSRLYQLFSGVTDKTRAEKLYSIIVDFFEIRELDVSPLTPRKVTKKILTDFINWRNKLFHGKEINKENTDLLKEKVDMLSVLCRMIISCIIDKKIKY